MKVMTGTSRVDSAGFRDAYSSVLKDYLNTGHEAALVRASELGRQALAERASLMELASIHHQALEGLLRAGKDEQRRGVLVRAAADFLSEFLSPYEMAQRGFQDVLQSLRQVNETLEEKIKRIAYAVHDEAGQLLVAVHLALAELSRNLPKFQQEQIERIEELLREVERHLRQYSHELRPMILDELGWIPAIRFLAEGISKRAGLPIHIRATVSERLSAPAETAVYRIVQEALTNAVKHAHAKNVWIKTWKEDFVLCCSIKDDGQGFVSHSDQASPRDGLGLVAMRERISAVGGTLRIDSSPGRGTEILIRLSVESGHANPHRTGG
jgi:two-component system, NarL family, sensor kinase